MFWIGKGAAARERQPVEPTSKSHGPKVSSLYSLNLFENTTLFLLTRIKKLAVTACGILTTFFEDIYVNKTGGGGG